MALTKQTTTQRLRVQPDFPELPKVFGQHQAAMDAWYFQFRQAVMDKLNAQADDLQATREQISSSTK